jgi:hypothetical protein
MSDCCRLGHIVTMATHNLILSNECTSSIKIAQAFILSTVYTFDHLASVYTCENLIFLCHFSTTVGSHLKCIYVFLPQLGQGRQDHHVKLSKLSIFQQDQG